jgi:hypothetical protein
MLQKKYSVPGLESSAAIQPRRTSQPCLVASIASYISFRLFDARLFHSSAFAFELLLLRHISTGECCNELSFLSYDYHHANCSHSDAF